MIFVDSNVLMYAVGRAHPLREPSRRFFIDARTHGLRLCSSAEVLQELLHAYLPVGRTRTLDAALALARGGLDVVWPIEADHVLLARELSTDHPGLSARDLLHLAVCRLHSVGEIKSYDRALNAAFSR